MNSKAIILLILSSSLIIYIIIKRFIHPFIINVLQLYEIRRNGNGAYATIVDFKTDKDSDGSVFYLQIVEYTVNDIKVRAEIEYPVKEKPIIGEMIPVYYSELNYKKVVSDLDKSIEKNFIGIFFLSVVVLLIIGFCIMKII